MIVKVLKMSTFLFSLTIGYNQWKGFFSTFLYRSCTSIFQK